MDRISLRALTEANVRDARKARLEAARLKHQARNIRQRVMGDRYLRTLVRPPT